MRGASGALVIGILAGASAAIVSPCQRLGEGITRTPRVTGSLSATLRNLPEDTNVAAGKPNNSIILLTRYLFCNYDAR